VADRSDYPAFVEGSWARLLRTAHLLVQDWAAAEDLTPAAPSYAAADYTTRAASWIIDVYEEEF
jgi:hypothetical protein